LFTRSRAQPEQKPRDDQQGETMPAEESDDKVGDLAGEFLDRFDDLVKDGHKPRVAMAAIIEAAVNDPCLAPSVTRRIAVAAAASQDRLEELCLLLARVALARRGGEIDSPAGYFGTAAKRMFVHKWKLSWKESPGARLRRER
jgi:hypothetical protein